MLLRCEKCGYKKANLKKCIKCGRRNPCPVKKAFFYAGVVLAPVAIIGGGIASAQWVAQKRVEAATSGAASFTAPREPKAPGTGTGGSGGRRGLSWR